MTQQKAAKIAFANLSNNWQYGKNEAKKREILSAASAAGVSGNKRNNFKEKSKTFWI